MKLHYRVDEQKPGSNLNLPGYHSDPGFYHLLLMIYISVVVRIMYVF